MAFDVVLCMVVCGCMALPLCFFLLNQMIHASVMMNKAAQNGITGLLILACSVVPSGNAQRTTL